MAREAIEFECNDCHGFFPLNLNLGMDGEFMIECPNCRRLHPRTIKKGELVGMFEARMYRDGVGKRIERNNKEGDKKLDVISVPKSAFSKESRFAKMKTASDGDFAKQSRFDRIVRKIIG